MSFRYKFSVVLISLGLVSAIMSFDGKKSYIIKPEDILAILQKGDFTLSPDQAAGRIADEDSSTIFVDVRTPAEYKSMSIPGAMNIPLSDLFSTEYQSVLGSKTMRTVFYSENDVQSTEAWMLSMQKGYENVYILKGGLEAWDSLIMKSSFKGGSITPGENAIFEKRYQARRLFAQWNSMPDSLKRSFFITKKKKDKELVGGCE